MSAALQHPMIGPYTVEDWLALDPTLRWMAAFRLARLVEDAIHTAGRTDLHVVPAVNVQISTACVRR